MSREIIAFDIDDVLAANAEGFVAFSNATWGTSLRPEDYHEHWSELWQVDMAETERRAAALHDSGIIATYRHADEALPVLQHLTERYELIAITSRRRSVEQLTRSWIDQHYAGIFRDIYFAGIFDAPLEATMVHRTKADLFAEQKVKYVVDDQLKHCLAAAGLGIRAVLFGNYSWNQAAELPSEVTRCKDWSAVEAYFDERS